MAKPPVSAASVASVASVATAASAATVAPAAPAPAPRRASGWQVFRALLTKDLRQEFRTRDMLTSMGIYAVLVLIVYGVALGTTMRPTDAVRLSAGLLWALVVFTSLLGLNRSFAHEQENAQLEGILLVPLDRGAIYLAKVCANVIFLFGVEIICVPAFWFLFLIDAPVAGSAAWFLMPLALGTIGIAGVGTLMSTITMHTRGRDVLLAVLLIPVIFPLLYACVSATGAAISGAVDWQNTVLIGVALAGGYDIIMILVSWLLYDFVVSV